ncbi:hypothetical protein DPMN_059130 [Dreissena polymorpha]|uniref:Reverse transcriptase n=1 Tax=Dreissena polymorpha TaxID=45954 RepID=A0A9D4C309_DREPO|nr:hypothetical protein DPMN_059130 [Dreissena polymorpha]
MVSLTNDIGKIFKWKHAFQTLLNCETDTHFDENNDTVNILEHHNTEQLNQGISLHDVHIAVRSLNKNKAPGHDEIPVEVIQSEPCIHFPHRLFCVCFETGKIPNSWNLGLITPVKKQPMSDKRDPTNYRGIAVTGSIYKAYCAVINNRLTKWAEDNNVFADEQNGFRRK